MQETHSFLTSLLLLEPKAVFQPHCIAFLDKAAAPSLSLSDIFGAASAEQTLQVRLSSLCPAFHTLRIMAADLIMVGRCCACLEVSFAVARKSNKGVTRAFPVGLTVVTPLLLFLATAKDTSRHAQQPVDGISVPLLQWDQ